MGGVRDIYKGVISLYVLLTIVSGTESEEESKLLTRSGTMGRFVKRQLRGHHPNFLKLPVIASGQELKENVLKWYTGGEGHMTHIYKMVWPKLKITSSHLFEIFSYFLNDFI